MLEDESNFVSPQMIGKSAVDSALAKTRDVPAYLNSSSMATSFNTDSVAQIS